MRLVPAFLLVLTIGGAASGATPGADALPLFFVPQAEGSAVRFTAKGSGLTAHFAEREAVFQLNGTSLRMEFPGASGPTQLEPVNPLPGSINFLIGDEADWRIGVPLYGGVVYRDLYPGIDMVYGGNGRRLKSEFRVAPGARVSNISIRYPGAGTLHVGDDGALIVAVDGQELREEAPVIYQERRGRRVPVEGRFTVSGDTVGFIVSDYDTTRLLIIDPVLSYSTLLGGSNSDAALGLAVDASGVAYVAGFTASYDLPTSNPAQNFNGGGNDIFVAKLNASGSGLVYATYIGGKGDDRAYGIAVDGTGAAYVTGSTTSTNFPSRAPLQVKTGGGKDAFVLKLNAAGNSLVYSTYLGGSGSDMGNGIAVDATGNAYVAGDTTSFNFPATGFQKSNKGSQDAFVVKVAPDGSRLVYSTYLGGNSDDHAAGIAVDSSGSAYVTGSAYSTDFPLVSALQVKNNGGQDAFVTRLNAAGSALLFSTYLGGAAGGVGSPEAGQGIALDAQGNAYVVGVTSSTDFPLLHAAQTTRRGSMDAFAAKVSAAGALVYSTYLGGTGIDVGNAIAVDAAGSAYVVGQTFSSDLPATGLYQNTNAGDYDAFLAKLSTTGETILALTYLGGAGSDTATAVALDTAGNTFVAGWTLSTNFPLLNGYQSVNGGNYGGFVLKMSVTAGPPTAVSVTPGSGSGSTQTFSFVFSDSRGYAAISSVSVIINSTLTAAGSCYLLYTRSANGIYVANDTAAYWQGPAVLGQSGTAQNSQCSVAGIGSSVTGSGSTLTLNVAVTFATAFSGTKNVYLEAYDGMDSGWQQRGTWTVPVNTLPASVSVTPASGSGSTQVFSFVYSDPKGYAALSSVSVIMNSTLTSAGGCYLLYTRSNNSAYVANDAATAWNGPVVLGQSGTAQNTHCTLSGTGSSATGSGNTLTVNLSVTFATSFSGAKNVYLEAYDGTDSGWAQRGTWTVPASLLPASVSVSPNSGSGMAQVFSLVYSDPKGYTALTSVSAIFNSTLMSAGSCYVLYTKAANALYLANDPVTFWLGPIAAGQNASVQNSQCILSGTGSSVTGSGNNLTVNVSLVFLTAFKGARNIYMEAYDGVDSGWLQRGNWTVQ